MTDSKWKKITAGILVFLIAAALTVFTLSSSALSTGAPAAPREATETLTTFANNGETAPAPAAKETRTPSLPAPTLPPLPSDTPTPSPTFAVWAGRVNVDRTNCRAGPGAPYISVAVLNRNTAVTVTGRDVTSEWLYLNFQSANEGLKRCWVETKPIDLAGGDVASLENYYPGVYQIPFWGDYKPPENVDISRSGNFVSIVWKDPNLLELSERENARSPRFIIEAWVCRDGALEFTVLGILDNTSLIIEDQKGCAELSSGLLYSAGRHGYSTPVYLLWPKP